MSFFSCFVMAIIVVISFDFSVGQAATLYQWYDDSGRLQMTDDLSKVPASEKQTAVRDVPALETTSSSGGFVKVDGKALYESKCAACHLFGVKNRDGKEGLGWILLDRETGGARPFEEIFFRLREAADGRTDMPSVNVSNGELTKIAHYLIKKSNSK